MIRIGLMIRIRIIIRIGRMIRLIVRIGRIIRLIITLMLGFGL